MYHYSSASLIRNSVKQEVRDLRHICVFLVWAERWMEPPSEHGHRRLSFTDPSSLAHREWPHGGHIWVCPHWLPCSWPHSFFFFFLIFLADTYTCPILGPLIPLFWISGDVSSGFQSQNGLPYSHCGGERNVRSLRSTSGATRCRPLDGKHCGAPTGFISCPRILLAPVGLEPAIKRSWVLRANHSATRPGHHGPILGSAHALCQWEGTESWLGNYERAYCFKIQILGLLVAWARLITHMC